MRLDAAYKLSEKKSVKITIKKGSMVLGLRLQ